jgi:hypothetical protein
MAGKIGSDVHSESRARPMPHLKYTLSDLLAESDYSPPLTDEAREWVAGAAVGREIL